MNGADAVYAGFADVVVASDRLPVLREALTKAPDKATAQDVRAIIDGFAMPNEVAPTAAQQPLIDALFGHDSIEEIVTALAHHSSEFAQATLGTILEKSPTGLKLTLKLLRMARESSLEQCLAREYRAALEIFVSHDFRRRPRRGHRQDRNPQWQPARIEDVTPEIIARYFAPRGADELTFRTKTREQNNDGHCIHRSWQHGRPDGRHLTKPGARWRG